MDEAFIIMQIGNTEMDAVCDGAIAPAIEEAGMTPRRVDRHNQGDLLKSEIVGFIERAQIIVADLTNERPNCYLEVGYAMGLGKKANLILTVRADHHWSHERFSRDGPRVHFDLEGYDLLFWEPSDLPKLKAELTQRIRRRAAIVSESGPTAAPIRSDPPWREELRDRAIAGLASVDRSGYMEVTAQIMPPTRVAQKDLLAAMRGATVSTFGWPIGVVLDTRDEHRPRPTVDGIEADVAIHGRSGMDHTSYDFWKAFGDGRFYTLLSLFEDERREASVFWDTRTNRVTEALLLLVRLYRRLGASDTDLVSVDIRHGGLAGRRLDVAGQRRIMMAHPTSSTDVVEASLSVSLSDLETNIVSHVKAVVDPLLMVFDFYEVNEPIITDIVNGFLEGEVR